MANATLQPFTPGLSKVLHPTAHPFMNLPFLLGALVVGGVAVWYFQRRGRRARWVTDAEMMTPPNHDGVYIAAATESAERVARLLPTKPTEDVSHLLGDLELPPQKSPDAHCDYLPDPKVEWIVTATFTEKTTIMMVQLKSVFPGPWLGEVNHPQVYGQELETGRWTFAFAADVTGPFTALKVAWPLCDPIEEDAGPDGATLKNYGDAATERLQKIGPCRIEASLTPKAAEATAEQLELIRTKFSHSTSVTLAAPDDTLFEGRRIWDVMLCLGLHWGDMDLFHWENPSDVGGDHHFSVSTNTDPGYFFPEQIARGETQVADLVFSFRVCRAAKPVAIGEAMIRCANYAQSRLGGQLFDAEGNSFSPEHFLRTIVELDGGLREAGFPPGGESTLRLF